MKTKQTHPLMNLRNLVTTVRFMIEREFAPLLRHHPRLLRLTLNEAEALAWETGFPHLILPSLAMEKLNTAATWQVRQRVLRPDVTATAFSK